MSRLAGMVALAMLALAPAATVAALTVTDQTGRTVTLAAAPRRISSREPASSSTIST